MRRFVSPTVHGPWRLAARLAAALLQSTIVFDLPDAWCDPLQIQPGVTSMSFPQPRDADACDDVCVADCFCCSTPLPALEPTLVARPEAPAETRDALVDATAAGFTTLPEHIPIRRS
jgi:hypothetical protein